MLFNKLRNWKNKKSTTRLAHRTCHGSSPRLYFRPRLEPLEHRTLLSAYLVKDINTNTVGSNPSNLTDVAYAR